jgi:hypothetical protein
VLEGGSRPHYHFDRWIVAERATDSPHRGAHVKLAAVPKSWRNWDFTIEAPAGKVAAQLKVSTWRDRGALIVADVEFAVRRSGSRFFLETPDGVTVATARRPRFWRREIVIEHDGRSYVLRADSAFRRERALYLDGRRLCSIAPDSWLGRRATVEVAEDHPFVLQAFFVWLTVVLWRQDAAAVAAASS